ncbi:MAG TPA: 2'-5' RNA ligase family protein [Nitrospiria bacterium]|nr:2'-5' RNA ligase family protein [Nitrospiria bacterium]
MPDRLENKRTDHERQKQPRTRRIAIDIVLLPPEKVAQAAIRLNRSLLESGGEGFELGGDDRIPHVSLAMGCVAEEKLPVMENLLEEIASEFPPVELLFEGVHIAINSVGERISSMIVSPTPTLQAIHEAVMRRVASHFAYDATAEAFIGYPEVKPTSVRWVNHYADAAAFDNFFPHITLGVGLLDEATLLPAPDIAERLALCHLGNYCTCRKILLETTLRG